MWVLLQKVLWATREADNRVQPVLPQPGSSYQLKYVDESASASASGFRVVSLLAVPA